MQKHFSPVSLISSVWHGILALQLFTMCRLKILVFQINKMLQRLFHNLQNKFSVSWSEVKVWLTAATRFSSTGWLLRFSTWLYSWSVECIKMKRSLYMGNVETKGFKRVLNGVGGQSKIHFSSGIIWIA